MFGNGRAFSSRRQGQQTFLNFRCQSKEHHDLRHTGAGDAFTVGNGSLVGDLAGVELASPLDGLAERLGDTRRPDGLGRPGRACLAAGRRNHFDDLAWPHAVRQGSNAAVLEGRVRPQGDLDGLLAVGGRRRAIGARRPIGRGDVDDPEDDLRLGARAVNMQVRRTPFACGCQGSNTVTFGEVRGPERAAFLWG